MTRNSVISAWIAGALVWAVAVVGLGLIDDSATGFSQSAPLVSERNEGFRPDPWLMEIAPEADPSTEQPDHRRVVPAGSPHW